jgi:hypothetical protein
MPDSESYNLMGVPLYPYGVMVSHLGVVDDPAGERESGEVERRNLFGRMALSCSMILGTRGFRSLLRYSRISKPSRLTEVSVNGC